MARIQEGIGERALRLLREQSALKLLRGEIGGKIKGRKLFPIEAALAPCIRPEFESSPLCRRSYLLQAAPQQERKIVEALMRLKIDAYLPLKPVSVKVNFMTRRTMMAPMMPGYAFPLFDEHREHWERIPSMDGVVRLFMMNMRPVPIPEHYIDRMRAREAQEILDGKPMKSAPYVAQPGQYVQIDDGGPWQGIFGEVIDLLAHGRRIAVSVDVFGRQTLVEVSVNQVRAV